VGGISHVTALQLSVYKETHMYVYRVDNYQTEYIQNRQLPDRVCTE